MMKKGFTLIEMVIVLGLLALLAGIGTQVFLKVMLTTRKAQIINQLEQNGNYALSIMEQRIRNAKRVDCAGAPQEITIYNEKGEYWTYKFFPPNPPNENGYIAQIYGSGPATTEPLTDQNPKTGVNVKSLAFDSCTTKRVSISMDLEQGVQAPKRREFQASTSLSTTVVVRGSYGE